MTNEEKIQLNLLAEARGYQVILRECCNGRRVHDIQQVMQGLIWVEGALLMKPLNFYELGRLTKTLEDLAQRTKKYHREWKDLQPQESL